MDKITSRVPKQVGRNLKVLCIIVGNGMVKQIKFSQIRGLNLEKIYILKYIAFIKINTNYNIILALSHYYFTNFNKGDSL